MEQIEYQKMAAVEDAMWWYQGLHQHLAYAVRTFVSARPATMLDAGCGTGGGLAFLAAHVPDVKIVGLDLWPIACQIGAQRANAPVALGSVNVLPFQSNTFDGILSVDVLCHAGVVSHLALTEAYRCLRPAGVLILNLPAYQWLLSYHDERVKNVKRFHVQEVKNLLTKIGFKITYHTYWNTLLFPLMVFRRKILSSSADESDVKLQAAPIEAFFKGCLTLERSVLHKGGRFPFGGSMLVVATKTV